MQTTAEGENAAGSEERGDGGTDLANFIHHVADHVPPHAAEMKQAVDDSLEIPPRSVRDGLAIFPFEALQILPYLVCCHCGSQTLKSLGKAVQPHLQITQMHLAATRRAPVVTGWE